MPGNTKSGGGDPSGAWTGGMKSAPLGSVELFAGGFYARGQFWQRRGFGKDCDLSDVAAVAVDVTKETWSVVSVATDKCRSVLIEIPPSDGTVVPRVAATASGNKPGE